MMSFFSRVNANMAPNWGKRDSGDAMIYMEEKRNFRVKRTLLRVYLGLSVSCIAICACDEDAKICRDWVHAHNGKSLTYRIFEGETADLLLKSPIVEAIAEPEADGRYHLTAVNALPCHIFTVDVGASCSNTLLRYSGHTRDGERLALYVYDPSEGIWDRVDDAMTEGDADCDLEAVVDNRTYVNDGILKALVAPELAANGADSFAFTGDTQNYTSRNMYIDGQPNGIYRAVTTWGRDEFLAGRIAHFHHAGDMANSIVTSDAELEAEWQIVDEAHRVLDEVGVPFSVSPGDHDSSYSNSNTEKHWNFRPYYEKTFPVSRFDDTIWYGDHYITNYDFYALVTIADRDFIFIGTGKDDYPYDWMNDVLARYRHRIAVIGRHAYLQAVGNYGALGTLFFQQVVSRNENVRLVLAGHVGKRFHQVTDIGGRKVVESVVDHTNYYPLPEGRGAEGYLSMISFRQGKLISQTYSPWRREYLNEPAEAWQVDFELPDTVRELHTGKFSAELCKGCAVSPVCERNRKCSNAFVRESHGK